MKKWSRAILLSLLIAAIGGLVWWAFQPREPVYEGKKFSAWLLETHNDLESSYKAQAAIEAIGTNALPCLIRMLRHKDSPLKIALMKFSENQNAIKFDFNDATYIHASAASVCADLGTNAAPAIPALVDLLSDNVDGETAGDALVEIGPEGVLALINSLTNTNTYVRYNVAMALPEIRMLASHAKPGSVKAAALDREADLAVPALMQVLTDKNDLVRSQAVVTLGILGRRADIVVPALVPMLKDANYTNSAIGAATAAPGFGREAESAVPALLGALKNPSPGLRDAAAKSLKKIDPEAATKAGVK